MRKPFLQPLNSGIKQPSRQVLTVSQLNRKAKGLVESEIGSVWLEGEISNFVCAKSGHWYFSLKDDAAQISCALFRFNNQRLSLSPQEGDKVIVKGKVSIYEARGDFQLVADYMEPAGLGQLQQQLDLLIKKMQQQGLFESQSKKALPFLPKAIGIITSPSGAAVHDVISVLDRRCPMIPLIIYPTQVQGKEAAKKVKNAIATAVARNECEVLIITRGGGSLEDLWCFNDESLAHAIIDCPIPTVAAIGHEVDTTITELVADLRAATPSAAAELVAPEQITLAQNIDYLAQDLLSYTQNRLHNLQNRLNIARLKLKDPANALHHAEAKLAALKQQLKEAYQARVQYFSSQSAALSQRLARLNPKSLLISQQHRQQVFSVKLKQLIEDRLQQERNKLNLLATNLNALSPLSTLARGYSITLDSQTRQVINTKTNTTVDQRISIMFSDGEIDCKVVEPILKT